jgi:hypothetical protein
MGKKIFLMKFLFLFFCSDDILRRNIVLSKQAKLAVDNQIGKQQKKVFF